MTAGTGKKHALTADQQCAAEVDVTTWVGASAGTGKTHVLAARVLGLMVTGTPPENILCMTYTRAAAAEMANRIYDKLGNWAVEREQVLGSEIFRTTGIKATDQQCQDARRLFARVLEIPGGLKIQTIHSFCETILKRFPLEATLSPHFQVMDDRTSGEFLKTAIDKVMQDSDKNPLLGQAFSVIAASSTETRFEKLVSAFIDKRGQLKHLLDSHGGEDGVVAALYSVLGVDPKNTAENIIQDVIRAKDFDREAVKRMVAVISKGSAKEKKAAAKLNPFFANPKRQQQNFTPYMEAFFTTSGVPRKSIFVNDTLGAHPDFEDIFLAEQKRLLELKEKLALLQVARNTEALVRLSAAVLRAYEVRKKAFGYLDFEDLVLETDALLRRPTVAQWILYKLDGRIDHILVDEAQDTNLVQWRLVEAIGDEFTSGRGAKDDLVRTIFAVGDIKQSIYSFQGAEPEEFDEAGKRTEGRVKSANLKFARFTLDLSFRSTRAVLELVDSVFAQPGAKNGIAKEDEEIRHRARREGHAGLVELWPLECPEDTEDALPGWQLPLEQKFSNKPDARLAAKIASKIHTMVEAKDILESRARPLRYGDILVLLRTRKDFMGHLIRELKTLGVPVAGSDRMVLSEQLVIEDLLALARLTLLPDDDYTLACVLKGPLLGVSEEALFSLAHGRPGSLWQALKNDKANTDIHAWLSGLFSQADFMTPFDFFSQILNRNNGRKKFIRRLGAEVNDPVDEFLALALEFEKTHSPSLQGFLSWFEAAQTEVKRDMERGKDEVRIMTIHGAKGLEAPVVFLPDTVHAPKKRGEELYQIPAKDGPLLVWSARKEFDVGPLALARAAFENEQRQEHNRLLYVALTRAEDRLYIAGWQNRKTSATTWYAIIEDALKALPGTKRVPLEDGSKVLCYQCKQTAAPEDKDDKKRIQTEAIHLKDWALRPPKKEQYAKAWVQPSRAASRPALRSGNKLGRTRGVIIHRLLEILPEILVRERKDKARAFMKPYGISKSEQAAILRSVFKVLDHPDFAGIFRPGSLAEASIVGIIDGQKVSGQVDRLVIGEDEILIIDYKSDHNVPERPDDVSPAYRKQLELYAKLLQGAYPGHRVRTALLWTSTCRLMPISHTKMSNSLS